MANFTGNTEIIKATVTLLAGADLTAAQNLFVKLDASGDVVLAGDGEKAIGVLTNAPDSGEAASVVLINAGNIVKVVAGAAITAGDIVSSSAAGKANTTASTDNELGLALCGADADLDYVAVLLSFSGITA